MANKKITDLPLVPTAQLTDQYETVQGGVSSQSTNQKVADLLGLGSGKTSFNNATGAATLATGIVQVSSTGVITSSASCSWNSGQVQITNPTASAIPAITVSADNNAGNGLISLTDSGAGHQAYAQFADGAGNSALFGLAGSLFILQSSTTPELEIQHIGGGAGSFSALNATLSGTLTVGGNSSLITMISNTAVLDFPSTNAQNSSDLTMTVTGAQVGDAVFIGVPTAAVNANSSFSAWVSAANTVNIRFNNYSSGAINPASGTFRAVVLRF